MFTLSGTIFTLIVGLGIYVFAYPFVDRVCQCIEHCSDNAAKNMEDENAEEEAP